jgi:ferrous iron transport protein B
MPPYRMPRWTDVARHMFERAWMFLRRAGTIILGISIILWALAAFPKAGGDVTPQQQNEQSFAGMAGRAIEPVIAPLGFDWRIGIGLITSFAAREVFNTTMSVVFSVEETDDEAETQRLLREKIRAARWPDGRPLFTPLVCFTLMVFYVFAMQCASTVAVVKRETNGWRWPLFQLAYMTGTAYVLSLLVYQGGRLLGFE